MDDRKLAWAASRLLRGGIAPRHVRRCVEELRAHRTDLIAQLRAQGHDPHVAATEAEARLGTAEDFIAATLARPELRGWASRAPWLVFVVLPVAGFVLLGVALVSLLIAWLELMDPTSKAAADPAVWRLGGALLTAAVLWVIPLGLIATILGIAWRSQIRLAWPAVGLLLVAAAAAAVNMHFAGPQAGREGELAVGAGYPPRDALRTALLFGTALGSIAVVWLRGRLAPTRP
jgi:hypothetical protein